MPESNLASLWWLTALLRLELDCRDCSGSWRGLAALSRLQHLDVFARRGRDPAANPLTGLPSGLSTLTALTHLGLWSYTCLLVEDTVRPQHLQRLGLLQHLILFAVATSAAFAACADIPLVQLH